MYQYKRSSALFEAAQEVLPGGVNSPVRAFKSVGGNPIFVKEAKGAYIYDEDNQRYIEYINSWGPMILGHSHPEVIEAIIEKARKGTSFGTPTEIETEIARLAIKMVPNIDKIRFVSSGTEACMSAVRLARGFTNKNKIIKFSGCYHGHSDSFLIMAGSGAITFGSPNSPGVTPGTAQDTLLAPYNDLEYVQQLFEKNSNEIAGIIIEPVAGNMGCVLPKDGFLEGLRTLCNKYNSLLIFDEVMTGFRLSKGGVQELYNVAADIVCFGKIIGGGMPVGAFAARNEIMNYLSPIGKVYQAGTLSGNPLAMAAGLKTLEILNQDFDIYKRLNEKTIYLKNGIATILKQKNILHTINQIGSMISVHFHQDAVLDFESAKNGDNETFKKFFHSLLKQGVYIAPSAYETWFLSDALTYEDLDYTLKCVENFNEF
jgi:glutamate-1-semialdehyde 2,1-aminomutase